MKTRHHWLTILSSKTSIDPTLVARRGYHQLIDWRSEISTNIAIILIDAIYKEFYKCWSSCPAYASAHSKTPSHTYKSLIKPLAYVLTHSSANAFPIQYSSERSPQSPEGPWVKRQKDG